MHSNKTGFSIPVARLALLGLCVVFLASCRLVIKTDDTGYITSASGANDCNQASCIIPITESFSDTFTAVPADGYRFVRWTGVCSRAVTTVCKLKLSPLPAEFMEFDSDVEMSAIFESSSTRRPWYRDSDGDGFGAANLSRMAFEQPAGYVIDKNDCDDSNKYVHPWAWERSDGLDNNCNGVVDEGFTKTRFYIDSDGDGYGDPAVSRLELQQPAGYVGNDLDCNDRSPQDNPAATEVVDNRDNDCDGSVDEGVKNFYPDGDGDGYGARYGLVRSIEAVGGYVQNNRDCDDNNRSIFPGAVEVFDSVDNDCDGAIDEGFTRTRYFRDADGDGFGDASSSVLDISPPAGFVTNGTDNCVYVSNPTQADSDGDGIGDACDTVDNNAGGGSGGGGVVDGGGGCSLTAEEQSMLAAVNATRAQARVCGSGTYPAVPALTWSCNLKNAALGHSADMANNNFFSHTGSDGQSPAYRATQAGYSWSAIGENIAAGTPLSAVSAVVQAWIDSPGHCANMMGSNYTQLGAAKYSNPASTYGVYWTQVFGRPR
ncbi:MAG: MopE-related protein [Gammaproteobacteria bacterium]|nr:MopE-related protein [Gammaproteobacteria bacterium]